MVTYICIKRRRQINRNKPKTQELISCPMIPTYENVSESVPSGQMYENIDPNDIFEPTNESQAYEVMKLLQRTLSMHQSF